MTQDEPESIQKDLADSFEAFRTAPNGYTSGTRASSDIGAEQFTQRFLAWHERESRKALQLAVINAELAQVQKLAQDHADKCRAISSENPRDDCSLAQQLIVLTSEMLAKKQSIEKGDV